LTSSCVHWTCRSSSNVQHYCPFFIYFLLCMSSLSTCAILLTVFAFSTYVVNKHFIVYYYTKCVTDKLYFTTVVVFCHSNYPVQGRFLLRAQDQNMTNGDFAFFTFFTQKSSYTDTPWTSYYAERDSPQHRQVFYVVKQVRDCPVKNLWRLFRF